MKVTAISANNNYSKPQFQGYSRTYKKERVSMYTTEERFYLPSRLVNLTPPAYYAKEVSVYIASPFEIVSEENLKNNNYLQRNDLYLNQIKKDYRNGYFNFASNATEEINFLTILRNDTQKRYDRNKELITRYNERKDTENFSNEGAREKYNERKTKNETLAKQEKQQLDNLDKQIDIAKERHELLLTLDKIGGRKNDLMRYEGYVKGNISNEKSSIRGHKERIAEIVTEFKETRRLYDKKIDRINRTANHEPNPDTKALQERIKVRRDERIKLLNEEFKAKKAELARKIQIEKDAIKECENRIAGYNERLQGMYKDFAELDRQLDEAFAKVDAFYRKNYPDWL